jgi:hypothetical protein
MEYSTYRAVLFRLNIICGFMAIVQLTTSSFHFAVLHGRTLLDRNLPTMTLIEIKNDNDNKFEVLTNVWNLNGSVVFLGIVALVVFMAVVCTVRAIQNVNLVGAIRYYWLILWIIPLQVRTAALCTVPRNISLITSKSLLFCVQRLSGRFPCLITSMLQKSGSNSGGEIKQWRGIDINSVILVTLIIHCVQYRFIPTPTRKRYVVVQIFISPL